MEEVICGHLKVYFIRYIRWGSAGHPLRMVDKALRPYYSLLLQSVSKQELPLVFATPYVEDPPALGYVGSMSIKNNTIYTTFINIPEMVEGFVLEALETHDLQLICALQKKQGKYEIILHYITFISRK